MKIPFFSFFYCFVVAPIWIQAPNSLSNNSSSLSFLLPVVETISIAFVLPNRNLTSAQVRDQLRQYFVRPLQSQLLSLPASTRQLTYRLQVNPVYTNGASIKETISDVFCSPAAEGINAVFILVDKVIQGDAGTSLANFATTLASAAGMPTIVWSTSAFELEADVGLSEMPRFLLTPSIRSQARALFAFLQTHAWQKFSLIESIQTPGHEVFADELHKLSEREYKESGPATTASFVHEMHFSGSRLMRSIKLDYDWKETLRRQLVNIRDNDRTRFLVLYCGKEQAIEIFNEARTLGMTSTEYTWVGAKPVVGDDDLKGQALHFVPGTVIVTYDTSYVAQLDAIKAAAHMWSTAVRRLTQVPGASLSRLSPSGVCGDRLNPQWPWKDTFIQMMKESKIPGVKNKSVMLEFDESGTMDLTRITLLHLDSRRQWEKFGDWTRHRGLHLNAPELMHEREKGEDAGTVVLKVVTLQEPPYISYEPINRKTNGCPRTAIPCKLSPLAHLQHTNSATEDKIKIKPSEVEEAVKKLGHDANDSWVCCVGFCVDLLRRLSDDLGFKYQLYEVADRKWGSTHSNKDGHWNGLVRALMVGEADLAMTSLKINKERSEAIAFSIPYLETGITMLVSVREVATSATAFLEPFSFDTWFAILAGLINMCAMSTFFFEYVSNLFSPIPEEQNDPCRFSPFSSLWLAWSMLFKAVVKVEIPKTFGARLMTCIWGMFCVIFASSYMANLAVFMITKDDFLDLTGLDDPRVKNPYSKIPPYRFATIGHGATETFLRENYGGIYEYIRHFNKSTVEEGVDAVKNGSLDAFIYDAKVLEYKVGRDKECKLRTVGKWYATTGYAIGFSQGSKWISRFDRKLIDYQHNGYLQQLTEFWLTGDCQRHKKQDVEKSYQLGVMNFSSAFFMLMIGISGCFGLLLIERFYSRYLQKSLASGKKILCSNPCQRINTRIVSAKNSLVESFSLRIHRNSQPQLQSQQHQQHQQQCDNCGGRGHSALRCSSPPMSKPFFRRCQNFSKEFSKQNFGDQQQQQESQVFTSRPSLPTN